MIIDETEELQQTTSYWQKTHQTIQSPNPNFLLCNRFASRTSHKLRAWHLHISCNQTNSKSAISKLQVSPLADGGVTPRHWPAHILARSVGHSSTSLTSATYRPTNGLSKSNKSDKEGTWFFNIKFTIKSLIIRGRIGGRGRGCGGVCPWRWSITAGLETKLWISLFVTIAGHGVLCNRKSNIND